MAAPFKAKATQLDGKKIVINFVLQKMVFKQQFVLKSSKIFSGQMLNKGKTELSKFLQKAFYGNITVAHFVKR